jgi:plasmid stabilization system protein ParE
MLPDEVMEAVEATEFRLRGVWEPQADAHADFATIKAHLLAREAEVERLREWRALVEEHNEGCDKACDMDRCGYRPYFENNGRRCSECPHYNTIDIPAHLSENSRGQ